MNKFFTRILTIAVLVTSTLSLVAQQLPDPGFENWSGATFDDKIQLANWHASNVEQVGFKFNFLRRVLRFWLTVLRLSPKNSAISALERSLNDNTHTLVSVSVRSVYLFRMVS